MMEAMTKKAFDLTFRSPSHAIKIEFQGREPLLNFDLIKYIVLNAKRRNVAEKRDLALVIATNLSFLTDEILEFCRVHAIQISTSLDGPADLHNANRPKPGNDSYEVTIDGIRRARVALGVDQVS